MAIAFVASTIKAPGANGGTTDAVDTTGSDLLVVSVSKKDTSIANITDNKSNSWTKLTRRLGGTASLDIWYSYAPTVGSGHTITYSDTGSTPAISLMAFSGVDVTENPFEQESVGSLRPSRKGSLFVSAAASTLTSARTVSTGFTLETDITVVSGVNYGGSSAYKIQTGSASIESPSWTNTTLESHAVFREATPAGIVAVIDGLPVPARNDFSGVVGYEFAPTEDIDISEVGRPVGSIFNSSHDVKIWETAGQTVVASATITTSSPLRDGYAYESITPITLSSGVGYRIASTETSGGDNWVNKSDLVGELNALGLSKSVYGTTAGGYPNLADQSNTAHVWPNMYSPDVAGGSLVARQIRLQTSLETNLKASL